MKKLSATVIFLIFIFLSFNANAENSAAGIWKTVQDEGPDKGKAKSHIEIYEKDGVYSGKIVKLLLKPQDTVCDKCESDLKDKPVVGMVNIQNMKKTGDKDDDMGEEYAGGTVMDPENGKTYKCKFWIKGDVLTLRGYIGFFFRTQKWNRVQ
jgi:uncharacterized protein (DUF2147 family)